MTTMFWLIFGMADFDVVKLQPGFKNGLVTQMIGSIMIGLYFIVIVIVLLNMFIGMLSKSYSRVQVSTLEIGHNTLTGAVT